MIENTHAQCSECRVMYMYFCVMADSECLVMYKDLLCLFNSKTTVLCIPVYFLHSGILSITDIAT